MAKAAPVYILGGAQSDFARNWNKEGKHFVSVMSETVTSAMADAGVEPREIQTAHVGNFAAELYAKQGQINAFFLEADPVFSGVPTGRHEAACASGSIAILAAMAEIEAGTISGRPDGTSANAKESRILSRPCLGAWATNMTSASDSRTSISPISPR